VRLAKYIPEHMASSYNTNPSPQIGYTILSMGEQLRSGFIQLSRVLVDINEITYMTVSTTELI